MKYINIITPHQFHRILEMYNIQLSPSQEDQLLHILRLNTLAFSYTAYRQSLVTYLSKQFGISPKQMNRLITAWQKYN